jgi:hypothetical protein
MKTSISPLARGLPPDNPGAARCRAGRNAARRLKPERNP